MQFDSNTLQDNRDRGSSSIVRQPPPQASAMSDSLQIFTQDIGGQNVAVSALMVGGSPWFRGADVALALAYKNAGKAVRDHVDQEDRQTLANLMGSVLDPIPEYHEGAQVFISESGVYALIMRSKKKEAKLFQRWVTTEVLPSIRRTGQYTAPTPQPQLEAGSQASVAGPTPYDLEMLRGARMQSLTAAYTAAQVIGSSATTRVQNAVQKAIDDALLPQGETPDQYLDAEGILRERGHTAEQIARLASEFGKDLKLVAESDAREPQSRDRQFGRDHRQVNLYHRVNDAVMIETVLASFKLRDLYLRVLNGAPDPIRARREQLLQSNGRGRSRSDRRSQ